MRICTNRRRRTALLAALAGLAFATTSSATAGAAVPDPERNATTPTGWHWWYGQTEAQVKQHYKDDGERIIDLEVQSTSPYRFAVATVRNTGAYARGWYWYYGLTADAVADKLKENNGRLIDLETYVDGGTRRFAVVMVRNTGEAAKNWHWYYGLSADTLQKRLDENASRLVDFESYSEGGTTKYAAVMIRNSGVDSSAWWYWRNVELATVQASAVNNDARTFSLERLPNGRYDAIQIKRKGEFSAYEIDMDARRAGDFVSQNGGRIVDLDTYTVGGARRFTLVVNDNADAFNGAVRTLARASAKLRAGRFGMFVKQLGGPVSVSLGADRKFEPASVMKILHHLYLHTRLESTPPEDLNALLQFPSCPATGGTGECAPGGKLVKDICPIAGGVTGSASMTLDNADRQMMAVSDNRATYGIEQRYGRATLNQYAASIGATSTQIKHTLGCWETDSDTTLLDLSRMIELASDGSLLPTASVRDRFFSTMIQGNSVSAPLQALVAEETAKAGKSSLTAAFVSAMQYRSKGGGYGRGQRAVGAEFGRILIPFKVSGQVQQRPFAFGSFFNCEDCGGDAPTSVAYGKAATEKFRAAIRAAVATW
jgi:hypothetical protein